MQKMIQLRHVPEPLHRKLKARASWAGLSLSDYLLREIEQIAERPTPDEMRERLARRSPVRTSLPPARVLRTERDSR